MPDISIIILLIIFGAVSYFKRKTRRVAQDSKQIPPQPIKTAPLPWAGAFPETAPIVVKPVAQSVKRPQNEPMVSSIEPDRMVEGNLSNWSDDWNSYNKPTNSSKEPEDKKISSAKSKQGKETISIIPRFTPATAVQSIVLHEVLTRPRTASRPYRS